MLCLFECEEGIVEIIERKNEKKIVLKRGKEEKEISIKEALEIFDRNIDNVRIHYDYAIYDEKERKSIKPKDDPELVKKVMQKLYEDFDDIMRIKLIRRYKIDGRDILVVIDEDVVPSIPYIESTREIAKGVRVHDVGFVPPTDPIEPVTETYIEIATEEKPVVIVVRGTDYEIEIENEMPKIKRKEEVKELIENYRKYEEELESL